MHLEVVKKSNYWCSSLRLQGCGFIKENYWLQLVASWIRMHLCAQGSLLDAQMVKSLFNSLPKEIHSITLFHLAKYIHQTYYILINSLFTGPSVSSCTKLFSPLKN